ncbi:FprA family A-type flavoprotein [Candidatus Omnitrophota bacterium]
MSAKEISPGVYWVGAIDWNLRHFHGHTYETPRGTTYNAYLVVDEKIALIDTVHEPFSDEMINNIKEIIPLDKIDFLIANHVEPDHSGALKILLDSSPGLKVYGTAKCKEGLNKYYETDMDFTIVKTGDKLSLGKKTLSFIEAPMLHWPDSMFSYLIEDAILFPNDGFGQHLASSERFDDEVDQSVLMDEAAKYYANILWPFSALVSKKIDDIKKLNIPIKIIAPSHGVIWRQSPGKILEAYLIWAGNKTKDKVVVVYETMWNSTAKMASAITEALTHEGISVHLFDINSNQRSEIIREMLDSRGFVIGSSTHDNDILPNMAGFMEFLKGLRPKGRLGACFGSYGWAGGATASLENILRSGGVELAEPAITVQYKPNEAELKSCYEFGKKFAQKVKGKILNSKS